MSAATKPLAELIDSWFKHNKPGLDAGGGDVMANAIIIRLLTGILAELQKLNAPGQKA